MGKALENIKGLSPEQIKEDSSMNRIYNIIQGDDDEDRNDEAEEILDEEDVYKRQPQMLVRNSVIFHWH